jgi:hypothetical protein
MSIYNIYNTYYNTILICLSLSRSFFLSRSLSFSLSLSLALALLGYRAFGGDVYVKGLVTPEQSFTRLALALQHLKATQHTPARDISVQLAILQIRSVQVNYQYMIGSIEL